MRTERFSITTQTWSKITLPGRNTLVMLFLLLSVTGAGLAIAWAGVERARQKFTLTLKAADTLNLIENRILAAEVGVRTYLATADQGVIEPLDEARSEVPRFISYLVDMRSHVPGEQSVLADLPRLVEAELEALDSMVEGGAAAGTQTAQLEELQARIDGLQTGLDESLITDFAALQQAEQFSLWTAVFVGLMGLVSTGWALSRCMRDRLER